jgi:c-di-GMP-binding flagellar brake protein YcgR
MEEAENVIGLAAHEMERRGMPRCVVDEEATLVVVSRGLTIPGRLIELSASGCGIVLREKLPQGMHAAVETIFRIRGIAFRLSGLTEWTAGSNTVGVSFGPMSARRRDDLLEVLCEVEAEHAAKTADECGAPNPALSEAAAAAEPNLRPALVARHPIAKPESLQLLNTVLRKVAGAESTPFASNGVPAQVGGVGPEAAAKNGAAGASGAGTAALTEAPTDAGSEARPNSRRDRRTEARCNVDSSVLIRLVKVASRLGGQILDMSLGGCRIHTAERFPVGIYTRVEVEFRLQGTALLLGGVVQAIHGRNEVGIRFLDVSPRKRELLAELIEEIREMRGSD